MFEEGGEPLGGGVEVEDGPGSAVEGVSDAFEIGFGVAAEITATFELAVDRGHR